MLRPVVAVVGPTAAGKSELSLALAHALDGEVVNADSMQVYRGMDVGTAKLTPAERQGVPHHLLDIWPVTLAASVSEYQELARQAIDDIRDRDRTASQALGYAQVHRFLIGEWDEAAAAAQTVQATRRFVRRQESGFRRDPRVVWVPVGADLVERALSAIGAADRG